MIDPGSLNADRFPDGSVVHAARATRGDAMNLLCDKLGVNDGTGRYSFGHGKIMEKTGRLLCSGEGGLFGLFWQAGTHG